MHNTTRHGTLMESSIKKPYTSNTPLNSLSFIYVPQPYYFNSPMTSLMTDDDSESFSISFKYHGLISEVYTVPIYVKNKIDPIEYE